MGLRSSLLHVTTTPAFPSATRPTSAPKKLVLDNSPLAELALAERFKSNAVQGAAGRLTVQMPRGGIFARGVASQPVKVAAALAQVKAQAQHASPSEFKATNLYFFPSSFCPGNLPLFAGPKCVPQADAAQPHLAPHRLTNCVSSVCRSTARLSWTARPTLPPRRHRPATFHQPRNALRRNHLNPRLLSGLIWRLC